MGEVGIARGQIELLASLFHADGPNNITPSAIGHLRDTFDDGIAAPVGQSR